MESVDNTFFLTPTGSLKSRKLSYRAATGNFSNENENLTIFLEWPQGSGVRALRGGSLPVWRAFLFMHIVTFNQQKERLAEIKRKVEASEISVPGLPTAEAVAEITAAGKMPGPKFSDYPRGPTPQAQRPTQAPQASRSPHRTVEELLAEFNAISDPGDQTIFWHENYQAIKRAQQRQSYAAAVANSPIAQGQAVLPNRKKRANNTPPPRMGTDQQ